MSYAHHSFSDEYSSYEDSANTEERRVSYSRGRSYRTERRRRGRKRASGTPGFSINGRRNRRFSW